MKANELRIGNLIKWDADPESIFTIEEINPEWLIIKNIHKSGGTLTVKIAIDSAVPIPFTEGWFIKMEWALIKDNLFYIHSYFSLDVYRHLLYCGDYTGINVDYIHSFQNLYFALTGEELTPNPTEK